MARSSSKKWCGADPEPVLKWERGYICVFLREADKPHWVTRHLVIHFQTSKASAVVQMPESEATDNDEFESIMETRASLSLAVYPMRFAPNLGTD